MPAPWIVGTPAVRQGQSGNLVFARADLGITLQAGDVLVCWLRAQGSNWESDWTLPAGWSRVGPAFVPLSAGQRVNGFYIHVVTDPGAEPSTWTFISAMDIDRRAGAMIVVRGVLLDTLPVGASSTYAGVTLSSPVGRRMQSFTPADTNGQPVLVLAGHGMEVSSGTNPAFTLSAGWTAAALAQAGNYPATSATIARISSQVVAAGAATGNADLTWDTGPVSTAAEGIALQGLPAESRTAAAAITLNLPAGAEATKHASAGAHLDLDLAADANATKTAAAAASLTLTVDTLAAATKHATASMQLQLVLDAIGAAHKTAGAQAAIDLALAVTAAAHIPVALRDISIHVGPAGGTVITVTTATGLTLTIGDTT